MFREKIMQKFRETKIAKILQINTEFLKQDKILRILDAHSARKMFAKIFLRNAKFLRNFTLFSHFSLHSFSRKKIIADEVVSTGMALLVY